MLGIFPKDLWSIFNVFILWSELDFFEAVIRGTKGVYSKQMKYVHNKCVCHAFMKDFIKNVRRTFLQTFLSLSLYHGDHYDGVLLVRFLQQRRKIKLLTLWKFKTFMCRFDLPQVKWNLASSIGNEISCTRGVMTCRRSECFTFKKIKIFH